MFLRAREVDDFAHLMSRHFPKRVCGAFSLLAVYPPPKACESGERPFFGDSEMHESNHPHPDCANRHDRAFEIECIESEAQDRIFTFG